MCREQRRIECADLEEIADKVGPLGLFNFGSRFEQGVEGFVLAGLIRQQSVVVSVIFSVS